MNFQCVYVWPCVLRWSGTCVCGECTCHDVDPSGDWGDIHGDTCECDERNCHATYNRYTDDFCSGRYSHVHGIYRGLLCPSMIIPENGQDRGSAVWKTAAEVCSLAGSRGNS